MGGMREECLPPTSLAGAALTKHHVLGAKQGYTSLVCWRLEDGGVGSTVPQDAREVPLPASLLGFNVDD